MVESAKVRKAANHIYMRTRKKLRAGSKLQIAKRQGWQEGDLSKFSPLQAHTKFRQSIELSGMQAKLAKLRRELIEPSSGGGGGKGEGQGFAASLNTIMCSFKISFVSS